MWPNPEETAETFFVQRNFYFSSSENSSTDVKSKCNYNES